MGLFALSLSAACAEEPVDVFDLEVPLLYWDHTVAMCGRARVVDGRRQLWGYSGCVGDPTGLDKLDRVLDEAEFQRLSAAFDDLPEASTSVPCMAPSRHGFMSARTKGTGRFWSVCGGGPNALDDLSDLPEPFRSVAAALNF